MIDNKSPEFYRNAIQKLFLIVDKQAKTVPFKLNEPQWTILSKLKDWDIILKARQEGISSLILAMFAVDFLTIENIRCVVIAHEVGATQKLLERVRFYLEALKTTFPGELPYKLKYNSKSELVNMEKNSIFYVGTAGSRSFGRGDTIQNCLASETEVVMKDGFLKEISKIQVGDTVVNGVGGLSKVTKVFVNDPLRTGQKELMKIKVHGNPGLLRCTPNHKLLIKKRDKSLGTQWIEASDLREDDYLGIPVKNPSNRRKELNLYQMSFGKRKNSKYTQETNIPVDNNFGQLIGWYLAEGHISKENTSVVFGIDTDEQSAFVPLIEKFKPYFSSFSVKPVPDSRTVRVTVFGADFTRMILYFAGKVKDKHIPNRVFKYGRDFLDGLVKGLFDGDGSYTDLNRVTFSNIRPQLIYQLRNILIALRIGYPSITFNPAIVRQGVFYLRNEQPQWVLALHADANTKFRKYFGLPLPEREKHFTAGRVWKRGRKYYWSKVASIERMHLGETVYDIEIDHPCHSFLTTFGVVHNCLASEFAFWPNQEKMYTGLIQAIPKEGRFIIESTANGVGNFHHSLWQKSQGPGSPFRTHFLPWFALSEYQLPITSFNATSEEQELQQAYNLTNEQMNWRRWKIAQMNGNIDTFNQEFPATADEAFIVSGNPIWSPTMLKKYILRCKDPIMQGDLVGAYEPFFEPNEKGMLKVWKEPIKGHNYVIGSDVAEGLEMNTEGDKAERTDYSCAYVMDKQTAELVACMHGRIEADLWGRKLELLGRYYQTAFIGVERNHQGLAPLMVLRDLNYPKLYYREKIGLDADKVTAQLGWWTDRFTRPLMIDEGGKWLREERVKIYDRSLLGEMLSFVRYPDGQGRATQGAHDDRVMSFLLTIQMYMRSPFSNSSNDIEGLTPTGDVNDFNFGSSDDMLSGSLDFQL